ncbi:nuclease [Mesobacillus campisalis]|uniref:Nuclease n=1 Tax=Mesobacillus campisalis TaxID=1408103 RepID=A0A0M2SYY1_9BACI|nr:nuclease-related domain-containing protein [Mesobacillus campisalis]KKK39784.1 nuclease [Mesobacillus campisalis]
MILKERKESDELLTMRYLNTRMQLTEKDKSRYFKLEKGYEGEVKFDTLAENILEERYILNDMLLEVNNSYFQIDSTIVSQGVIYLLDIKNFEGDYFLDSDKFYSVASGREYKNPLDQLKRSTTLFRHLLQIHRLHYLVESFVIFINQEFTLYQAPMNQPLILPTQVNRFLKEFDKTPSKLDDGHKKLSQKLMTLHQPKNPFSATPAYEYSQVKKGCYCKTCKSFKVYIVNYHLVCENCGGQEKIEHAILRHMEEFKLLFPDRNITTHSIYEWCQTGLNEKTIRRIMKKNFTAFGNTRDTYYK